MLVDITTYYLEMTTPTALRPKRLERSDLAVTQAHIPSPELSRFLYTAVGGRWYWLDRLPWTYQQWRDWLERPAVSTWVAYLAGTPAGYVELAAQAAGSVEIVHLGLLPRFLGQGLGGHLLTVALEEAWRLPDTTRVWVHTDTLDHPSALANYSARGMQRYRERTRQCDIPEQSPGPWPGAQVTAH